MTPWLNRHDLGDYLGTNGFHVLEANTIGRKIDGFEIERKVMPPKRRKGGGYEPGTGGPVYRGVKKCRNEKWIIMAHRMRNFAEDIEHSFDELGIDWTDKEKMDLIDLMDTWADQVLK